MPLDGGATVAHGYCLGSADLHWDFASQKMVAMGFNEEARGTYFPARSLHEGPNAPGCQTPHGRAQAVLCRSEGTMQVILSMLLKAQCKPRGESKLCECENAK